MASRLAAGESTRKIAQETNQRPEALNQLFKSDEFLEVLRDFDSDLADDILHEREQAKPEEYESYVLQEATKSIERLAVIRDYGETESASVAAAKAIVDIAEKVKKVHVEEKTRRTSFPTSQLAKLVEAGKELDEMEARVRESARAARAASE